MARIVQTHKEIPISRFTLPQTKVFKSKAINRVLCSGRQIGKTFLLAREILQVVWGIENAGKNAWYVTDTRTHAYQIFWKALLETIPDWAIVRKDNILLDIELINGSTIGLRGTEDLKQLRGCPPLDLLCFDEAAFCKKEAWDTLSANLAVRQGRSIFTSTPYGYNWFYDLYQRGFNPEYPNWECFHFTTEQGGLVDKAWLDEKRKEMDPKMFSQEFEGSFVAMTGRVYYAFDIESNVTDLAEDDGTSIIHVGMDFNKNPMTASLSRIADDKLLTFKEYEIWDSNTDEMCRAIKNDYPDRHIIVYPDASGAHSRTSSGGHTDFTIIEEYQFKIKAPKRNPDIEDRVNNVNRRFLSADGERKAFINPRCTKMIKCFDGQVYKEGTNIPDKSAGLDHFPDGYGYKISMLYPLVIKKPILYRAVKLGI